MERSVEHGAGERCEVKQDREVAKLELTAGIGAERHFPNTALIGFLALHELPHIVVVREQARREAFPAVREATDDVPGQAQVISSLRIAEQIVQANHLSLRVILEQPDHHRLLGDDSRLADDYAPVGNVQPEHVLVLAGVHRILPWDLSPGQHGHAIFSPLILWPIKAVKSKN